MISFPHRSKGEIYPPIYLYVKKEFEMSIVPKITKVNQSWLANMDHELREDVWSLLHNIQDHVVNITSMGPNKIMIEANEGYDPQEGLFIFLVSIYGATMKDIKVLTDVIRTYADHLDSMSKLIPQDEIVSVDDIKPYLDKYIQTKVEMLIIETTDKYPIKTINTLQLHRYKGQLSEARRAFEFSVDKRASILPAREIRRRHKSCTKVISQIDNALTLARRLNFIIDGWQSQRDSQINDLIRLLKNNPVNSGPMLKHTIKMCSELYTSSRQLLDSFVEEAEAISKLADDVISLTPPVPSK